MWLSDPIQLSSHADRRLLHVPFARLPSAQFADPGIGSPSRTTFPGTSERTTVDLATFRRPAILAPGSIASDEPMVETPATKITESQQELADAQIREKQREVKYDLRDFTIDYIIKQFREGLFYVPEYQRNYVWPDGHRWRFIESVLLGLPIPMMFVADMEDGRLEIVDGAQRIQTLEAFDDDSLRLDKLT